MTLDKTPRFASKARLTLMLLVTALCALGFVLSSPSFAENGELVGLGDKCIDVFGADGTPGTAIVLWQCTGNANQDWRFVDFGDGEVEIQGLDDQCAVMGDVGESGFSELVVGACGTSAARWQVDGFLGALSFKLRHVETNLCADVLGQNTANGTPIIGFNCVDQVNQDWRWLNQRSLPAYFVPFFWIEYPYFADITTFFAVRNPASYDTFVRYEYFYNFDEPGDVHRTELNGLPARGVRTVDLKLLSFSPAGQGWIGVTAVDESTNKAFVVQDLYGDYFTVDSANDFATGDRLRPTDSSLCSTWHIRFLSGGDFDGGTAFRFFVPEFEGERWSATGRVFEQSGQEIESVTVTSSSSGRNVLANTLPIIPSFGAIEWTFDDGVRGHVSAVMSALNRFSVGFDAECRD